MSEIVSENFELGSYDSTLISSLDMTTSWRISSSRALLRLLMIVLLSW